MVTAFALGTEAPKTIRHSLKYKDYNKMRGRPYRVVKEGSSMKSSEVLVIASQRLDRRDFTRRKVGGGGRREWLL